MQYEIEKSTFRAPAYPLVTIDPYTSLWCMGDNLTGDTVRHWTGHPNALIGLAEIDEKTYRFMGVDKTVELPAMEQTRAAYDSFSTVYTMQADGVELTVRFTSPLLPDDLLLLSRPVSYVHVDVRSMDGKEHQVKLSLIATDSLCLGCDQVRPVLRKCFTLDDTLQVARMGNQEQPILGKSGDKQCIDWGYVYIVGDAGSQTEECTADGRKAIAVEKTLKTDKTASALFLFAYDDVYSIVYFGERLQAYWKKDGQTIEQAMLDAFDGYAGVLERCRAFNRKMVDDAMNAGGEKYAQLLQLAVRQVLAAHKLVLDTQGNILYISKECFSNGSAATVDVSYPSIPMFLLYNTELIKGMLRPIYRFAQSEAWPYEFAPHDGGTYPILNGQTYGGGLDPKFQMPVEECGNMLIMTAALSLVDGKADFARDNAALLEQWASYLWDYGLEPADQLCTDDFAGRSRNNCNLSIKAIMGIVGYSKLCTLWGEKEKAARYWEKAQDMAKSWLEMAVEKDGKGYSRTFDGVGTFSMKYNAVWDKLWGTDLFKPMFATEIANYQQYINPYGLPLDERADYTKSDWLVWTASLADSKKEFMDMIQPLWLAYHKSPSRSPMTDWYSTITSLQEVFQNRTVMGGIWIKLLLEKCGQ